MERDEKEEALKTKNDAVRRKDNAAYIFLSTFLLILSFFIVLVSIAHIDTVRAALVFQQLSSVMAENTGLRILQRQLSSFVGTRVTDLETLKALNAIWSAKIPFISQELDPARKVLEINVPYHELISLKDRVSLRPDREELLIRSANLLNVYGTENLRTYMTISYVGPRQKPLAASATFPEIKVLATIAARLEEEKIPSESLILRRLIKPDQEPHIRFNISFGPRIPKQFFFPLALDNQ